MALSVCIAIWSCIALVAAQQPHPAPTHDDSDYQVWDQVLIPMRDGGIVSATVGKKNGTLAHLPALLTVEIYTDPAVALTRAKDAADHGYVGVIADTRGKRLSPDAIAPYEHEANDAYDIIDWITKQPWSDGQVGMRGGSYSGFSSWAATKTLHPALKTIAVSAAAIPGDGLPMANNIFLNANYGWAFYVTNNKLLDNKTYNDRERWNTLPRKWFFSGEPYRSIDQVDGTPNPLLQRWLQHPAYDRFWQDMVPYKQDFEHIDIPILTITGYYDDGQQSALDYTRQHYQYNPKARHFVVIGPYDHLATHSASKPEVLRGYAIDPVAQFSTPELIYQWMDYVLKGSDKPALLKDKINYEVMGANIWRHASSLAQMSQRQVPFYFGATRDGRRYSLERTRARADRSVLEKVDLGDRSTWNNSHYYPASIIETSLEGNGKVTEVVYASKPFTQAEVISGAFSGELDVTINKKDADLGLTVFEQTPDGRLFHLAYWLGRASYAGHPERRALLTPGHATRIPFETPVVSRKMAAGSCLVVLLDVDKNPFAQVNYGTGKDVSDESIHDAGAPLTVRWHNDSFIKVPLGIPQ
ncbi:MAG: CocE/NonD family hydrolase [Acidobacteriota bacterium]|nr:CocE/NonD family hydrolase [Acidobacteriota bacterium]